MGSLTGTVESQCCRSRRNVRVCLDCDAEDDRVGTTAASTECPEETGVLTWKSYKVLSRSGDHLRLESLIRSKAKRGGELTVATALHVARGDPNTLAVSSYKDFVLCVSCSHGFEALDSSA